MYKPPENTNRVKAMKMKFESHDSDRIRANITDVANKPKIISDSNKILNDNTINSTNLIIKPQQSLNRQLSDPAKRNIKRTPAFRLDKNAFIEKEHMFQRHSSYNHIKSTMDKFKSLDDSSRLKENCDNNVNIRDSPVGKNTSNKIYNIRDESNKSARKEIRDDDNILNDNQKTQNDKNIQNIVRELYSEPIPKALRASQRNNCEDNDFLLQNKNTLKLEEKHSKIETAQNVITILKDQQTNGSDTIKNALKRPLPPGPAPKKPPRTFQHSPQNKLKCDTLPVSKSDPNIATLKLDKEFTNRLNLSIEKKMQSPQKAKKDPKYMLEKLENALKNNKIKLRRQAKIDYNSEEEDNVKNVTKSLCNSPQLKRANHTVTLSPNQMFGNCLPSLSCSKNTYARIKEPNSSFFVSAVNDEPVYAEPFQYDTVAPSSENNTDFLHKGDHCGMKKNSLYYMSNPVLGLEADAADGTGEDMDNRTVKEMVNQCETSSLSTFSSDSESNVSTPVYVKEPSFALVKDLIKSFEDKSSSSQEGSNDKTNSISLRAAKQSKLSQSNNNNNDGKRYGVLKDTSKSTGEQRKRKDTKKFEIYVKTVRAFSIRKMSNDNLFHCCLLVGLDEKSPYIKSKFPSNVQIPAYIEKLCFPDSDDHRVSYSAREQCYSLVITDASGERIYGYCRRVLPEGSCCCLPLAYCILTKNRAPRFYKRILQELESHHGLPDKQRDAVINEFYKLKFPKPGQSIKLDLGKIIHSEVKYYATETAAQNNNEPKNRNSDDSLKDFCMISCPHGLVNNSCNERDSTGWESCMTESSTELVLALHQDTRYEETDLKELCDTLDVSTLQKVFENLLLERKVIFTSCQLSKLSSCIEAIQSVLYPFSWPHAFIPVLPKTRWEIVEAPAPLICGVLSSSVVNEFKIENGIVVDLDTKQIILQVDEEEKILPCSALKYWKKGLSIANSIKTTDNEHNVLLSDAFIRVFILTCGHYRDYISNGSFDKQGFKDYPSSKGIKRFLQWFTLTTMFDLFIEAALSNPNSFYIFDSRIKIYSSSDATLILEKMKDWTNNLKF